MAVFGDMRAREEVMSMSLPVLKYGSISAYPAMAAALSRENNGGGERVSRGRKRALARE